MSKTITSGGITFVDLSDSRKLDIYISSNLPTTQIYNSNTKTYSPDWSANNLQLLSEIYLDSKKITPESIKWYTKSSTDTSEKFETNGATFTIKTNILSTNPIMTYICRVTYQGIQAFKEITFTRIDTGLNGLDGADGTGVTILGSYNTLAELQSVHPIGNDGDAYIIDGDLYVWAVDDSKWENVGNIQGPAGADGKDAKNIILSGDSQVFKVSKSNIISPVSITIRAQAFNTTVTDWAYSTNGGQTFSSNEPTGVYRNGNIVSVAGTSETPNSIVIKASDGEISDVFTIYKVVDGSDGDRGDDGSPAPIAFLTNENITFSANAQGRITTTTIFSNIVAYSGTTKILPAIGTITNLPEGMTISSEIVDASREIMLTITVANNATLGSALSNNGTIYIPVTSPVSTVLSLNWSKINTGATGAAGYDAYTVVLTNESNTFAGNVSSAIASSTTTQVLAYKGSVAQTVTISTVNGIVASTEYVETGIAGLKFKCSALNGTAPTITFSCTTSFVSPSGTIPIVLSVGGVSVTKIFSYSIAFKGATGGQGSAGAAASSYWLISSAAVVQKTSTETITVTPSELTFTGRIKTGTNAPIDYPCRWIIAYSTDGTNYTNLYTSASDEATKSITVATTYKTIRARMYLAGGTATLLDEQIIPVVTDGINGVNGTSVTVSSTQYQASTSSTTAPTGTWSNSVVTVAEGSYLWTKTTFSDGKTAYSVAKQGTKGSAGINAVTFQIYAPNGYLLTTETPSLTLQTFAYEGSTAITTGATFKWYSWTGEAWNVISGATSGVLTVTKTEVLKSNSYKCEMTYKNITYIATATVEDKTDIYESLIRVNAKRTTSNNMYWILYATVYSEEGERDALLGPIGDTAPTSPTAGAYWYKVDTTNYTITLMKYSGTAWTTTTDTQELHYDWFLFKDTENMVALGGQSKVVIVTPSDFSGVCNVQCNIFDPNNVLLSRNNQILNDPSDPIVSDTVPSNPVDGQLWLQVNTDGTYLLSVWNASSQQWLISESDSRNKVYVSKPVSYNAGDIWIVGGDYQPAVYLNGVVQNTKHLSGTMLKAQYASAIYKDSDWVEALNYRDRLDSLQEQLDAYDQFFSFDSTGLTMGAKNLSGQISEFKTKLTNTELGFYQGDDKVAYINNNQLNISKAQITNGLSITGTSPILTVGDFSLIQESNGSLSIITNL